MKGKIMIIDGGSGIPKRDTEALKEMSKQISNDPKKMEILRKANRILDRAIFMTQFTEKLTQTEILMILNEWNKDLLSCSD